MTLQKLIFFNVLLLLYFFPFQKIIAQNILSNIVINEINYRSLETEADITFVELYNAGTDSTSLSSWQLEGGINYQFPTGTKIPPGEYLVVAADIDTAQTVLNFSGALGPFIGGLNNESDKIILRNLFLQIEDEVKYDGWKEWPDVRNTLTNQPISIQKINPLLPSKHPGSWRSAAVTPNAKNTNVYISNPTAIPIIKKVSKSPDQPLSGEFVRIEADFNNLATVNGLQVNLEYQAVDAGDYIGKSDTRYQSSWISIPMKDDGIGADSTAGNGIHTADIPSAEQIHRRLIRYRIKVTTADGYDRTFPDQDHPESNYAYFVYNKPTDYNGFSLSNLPTLPEITLITTNSHTNINILAYLGQEYLGEGTLVYNGKVYDHIRFRSRGRRSRHKRPKRNLKFDLNKARPLTPVDDCGKSYKESRSKLVLSGTWVGDPAVHGLAESLCNKLLNLTGGLERAADYNQLRIIDDTIEEGKEGDFWGLYLVLEDFGGSMLDEHKLPDGDIWVTKPLVIDYDGKNDLTLNVESLIRNMWFGNRAANTIYGQNANNYYGKHSNKTYFPGGDGEVPPNTRLDENYLPAADGKQLDVWSDLDNAFGSPNDDFTTFKRDTAVRNILNTNADVIPDEDKIEYQGMLRSMYDLILNPEQRDFLVDMESRKIYQPEAAHDWTTIDKDRWDTPYDLGTIDAHVNWYKEWLKDRAALILTSDTNDGIKDVLIPNKPIISLTGSTAINELTFTGSAYAGTNAFAAMEWRIGEWSDPTNSFYAIKCKPKYEVQEKWASGEISTFSATYTIPHQALLEAERTYKVRARYKDQTGRWSHWSDPVSLKATPANNPVQPAIVINEISYTTLTGCSEFIEIINGEDQPVDISSYTFTDGIDYTFPLGTTLAVGQAIVLAEDSLSYVQNYGSSPFGQYKGGLLSSGERIELRGWYDVIIDSLTFNASNIWDENPLGYAKTLELLNPALDNNDLKNWFRSESVCGTPAKMNSLFCDMPGLPIVINEINYNSNNFVADPGDWVELYNPNASDVDLSNWYLYDEESGFRIPAGIIIPANGYLVLVENKVSFSAIFPSLDGALYIGDFGFSLSGKGERISLFDGNDCLSDYARFNDKAPWPTAPDGDGPTLSLLDPSLDNTIPTSWESSAIMNGNSPIGSPGYANICVPGVACNDGNDCTFDDVYDANCNCSGIDFDINLLGQLCDDGNPLTEFDTYNECGCSGIIVSATICNRISHGLDDMEEYLSLGTVDANSSDLEMVFENEDQLIGLRFNNIEIPQGATITNATLQFTTDEVTVIPTDLIIKAEASDNAISFFNIVSTISSRPTTNAAVSWSPPAWNTIGESAAAQQSPNIAALVQEVVNQAGYAQGNSIAFIISGTGERVAESFEGDPLLAPELCITYSTGQCVEGYPCEDGDPFTVNDAYNSSCDCVGDESVVFGKVLLEGYLNSQTGLLKSKLNELGLIPLTQPYNTTPWNYNGGEQVSTIPTGIIDWILVMSRDASGTVLSQAAGFINEEGALLGLDGTPGILMENITGNFISIHHRSHLAVISATPYTVGEIYDFTTSSDKALGNQQQKLVSNKFVLYAGDYDANGLINNTDFNKWKIQSAVLNQYIPIDGDGNGIVNSVDYNLWINNRSKVGEPKIRY